METTSSMSANDVVCFELGKTTDPDDEATVPDQADQSLGPAAPPSANSVRRLSSSVSEQEPDLSPQGGGGGGGDAAWDRSSLSLCSDRRYRSSNSCLSTEDSYAPAPGEDCAALVLSCLHCRFRELAAALPGACVRALWRLFPSLAHAALSREADPLLTCDWCGCQSLELDCGGRSCHDTAELLELAMEISEVCYR